MSILSRIIILVLTSFMLVGCSGKKDESLLMRVSEKCAAVLLNKKEAKPRVNDAFAALDYLQDALKEFSSDKKDRELQAKIMDQAAHLLVSKKMYKEAMPYIEGVMKFFSERKDTMSTVATLHELGGAYAHAGGLSKAEECFFEVAGSQQPFFSEAVGYLKNVSRRGQAPAGTDRLRALLYPSYSGRGTSSVSKQRACICLGDIP